mmetsp:Transcript_2996/g.5751  ORF Transcript_2996/g.5751 Transcript_2996/m.5751 type:complete len:356 (-) Transcript_2996:2226-3293(-)|eukprot:CAMPEP_0184685146 /NCGR_PEP_ID=MMETSP0312-20130426/17875_1 /TAXON_ID=31354 /ORGANISM="Compsopogon coeruleus, Strain SAG 36.94" /LENGTH=355 /DNA_ID=CAMNT_0027138963 /DNA_START=374 /DNA_END=1441 /DNA_ORIENTATION=-
MEAYVVVPSPFTLVRDASLHSQRICVSRGSVRRLPSWRTAVVCQLKQSGGDAEESGPGPVGSEQSPSTPKVRSKPDWASSAQSRLLPVLAAGAAFLLVGSSFLPFFLGGNENLMAPLSSAEVESKLASVPVFSVTDRDGRPFLSERSDGSRVGYFFLDPNDAKTYLSRALTSTSPSDSSAAADNGNIQIFPLSLQNAVQFARRASTSESASPPPSRKGQTSGSDQYLILANEHERELADKIVLADSSSGSNGSTGDRTIQGVPLFFVDGLGIRLESSSGQPPQTVIPLFFNKEDLDEMVAKAKGQSQLDLAKNPIEVVELSTALDEMRRGTNPRLGNVMFYPPSDGVAFLKSLKP